MMNFSTQISKATLPLIAFLLVGCSAANRVGGWITGGEPKATEIAYVPPTTAAPEQTKVYQSQSYQPKKKEIATQSSSDWGLEDIETDTGSDSIFNQPIGDAGYVRAETSDSSNQAGSSYTMTRQPPSPPANGVFRGGPNAPRIYAQTLEGGTFDSAQHLGKVVLVDFWFSTCGPCLRAMPHVDKLRKTYSEDQLAIVAVNHDKSKSAATAFLRRNSHDWPQIFDRGLKSSLVKAYGVKLFPTFVVIDQMGNVQYQGTIVQTAAAKVTELIEKPSISENAAGVGVVASGNRPG
ncbi:MAG: TlpA family protein disulfide reductase [Candidatus Omnitrophica bacterium]|nr:TlpA family protein disulfide reductase [Candidatus Omnitrophota bacterium]MCA9423632.1 TlpA family protein disulfide reductase [Candidatus Omnitrophota bacterium]MCA9430986.1 TlpA family protein disulfide reductase [Candidatus Omnitrophota bacterium]MCA9435816.1 TlpA family protein disulfide reductase [Candidatus Omnitrophota bacterium]MCA9440875.1 TlpA family protein disulfide reductase [Candidatus Omnitrophota bacterium]